LETASATGKHSRFEPTKQQSLLISNKSTLMATIINKILGSFLVVSGWIFETSVKFWLQEFIVKLLTNKVVNAWKEWELHERISDKQAVMAYLSIVTIVFATATRHLYDTHKFDNWTIFAYLSCAVCTCVSGVLLGLVSVNDKLR
jgi:hypothetical protein